MLYRGLKRTGRVLAFTARAYFYAGQVIVLSPGGLLKHPDAILFIPVAPLAVLLAPRCGCLRDRHYGEHDVRQEITAQEFTFSYAR